MPTQQSVSPYKKQTIGYQKTKTYTKDECLLKLRHKEIMAYHYICGVFRAQGHLTPEKLKLLKEIAAALYITEDRHRAECTFAATDDELNAIADCVAGPNSVHAWKREGRHPLPRRPEPRISRASLRIADIVAAAALEGLEEYERSGNKDPDAMIHKTIEIDTLWFDENEEDDYVDSPKESKKKPSSKSVHFESKTTKTATKPDQAAKKTGQPETETSQPVVLQADQPMIQPNQSAQPVGDKEESVKENGTGDEKEDEKDTESSSTVSSASEDSQSTEEEQKSEVQTKTVIDQDITLMPPPPPVITVPPPISPLITVPPPTSPVITVPPPTSPLITVLPPTSPLITVPSPPPVITVPPPTTMTAVPATSNAIAFPEPVVTTHTMTITTEPQSSHASTSSTPLIVSQSELEETPILTESDEVQFMSFTDTLDSGLPPLVVVPPAEPVITVPHSSSFSPTQPTSTFVLPSGMSIQLREDNGEVKKRKRSLSLSHDTGVSNGASPPKSLALSQITKMTPVVVSAGGLSSQGQVKVTPIISRSKLTMTSTTQPSNLATTSQKVIIVSNTSSTNAPIMQRSLNMPVGVPIIRASPPRIQPAPGLVTSTKLRPKMVTVPAKCRAKGSPLVIPMGKNTITLKQDNVTVVDTSMKRVPLGSGPAKILPKPQGPMYIVNSSQGKIATTVTGQTRMINPRIITQGNLPEGAAATLKTVGSKQNVMILQKGGGSQRALTLTNTSKDLMQKLLSKKCVVIQSPKGLPKNISPKPQSQAATSPSNVVVLDLSQEQNRQNFSNATLAEILQASGIISTSGTQKVITMPPRTTTVSAPEPGTSWQPVEASKSLSLEEVTLPIGQTESIVTLDEAVDMLGGSSDQQETLLATGSLELANPSHTIQVEGEDTSDHIFTISQEELAASEITFMSDKSLAEEPVTSQIVIETMPTELTQVSTSATQVFLPHRDGAVTIQHSNIDMPANMSLEEYSSQQMENQGLN